MSVQTSNQYNNQKAVEKKAAIPKKSASVIICRQKQPQSNTKQFKFDYDFLMLRRNPKLSFGGMVAFPGGNMDKEDQDFLKNQKYEPTKQTQLVCDWQNALIYTGVRELFEETGLIIAQRGQEQLIIKLLQNEKLDFYEIYNSIGLDLRNICIPFLRIITNQSLPRRWDTQFFVIQIEDSGKNKKKEEYCLFNILKYKQTNIKDDLYNTNDLILNQDESDMYFWENPLSALEKHAQRKTKLPIPQLLICNLMSSLQSIESIKSYLQQIEKQHDFYQKLESKDYLKYNPSTFPFIVQISTLENKQLRIILCGDEEYHVEKLINGEDESEFKSVQIKKGQNLRLESDFSTEFKTSINCDFLAPFTLLRNINLLNIQGLSIKPNL